MDRQVTQELNALREENAKLKAALEHVNKRIDDAIGSHNRLVKVVDALNERTKTKPVTQAKQTNAAQDGIITRQVVSSSGETRQVIDSAAIAERTLSQFKVKSPKTYSAFELLKRGFNLTSK